MSGRVDGYASPMRGKSQTCRRGHFFFLRVSDQVIAVIDCRVLVGAFGQVEDVPRIGVAEP